MHESYFNPICLVIGALVFAWILSLFGVDKMFIKAVKDNKGTTVTTSTYYMFFLVASVILAGIVWIRQRGNGDDSLMCVSQLKRIQQKCGDCASE